MQVSAAFPYLGVWRNTSLNTTVHSFSEQSTPFASIPIGPIATSWTNDQTGETFVLLFPESLYFGDRLPYTLLCPNQMRAFGVTVNDTPQQYDARSSHAIAVDGDKIPLFLDGVISYFESRKPSDDELENCRRIVLTSDSPWNPRDSAFAQQENVARSRFDPIIHEGRRIQAIATKEKKTVITQETLARRWGIGLKTAERTLRVTTQRGIRTFLRPFDRRLSTSVPQLSYSVLKRTMYSDTMFSKVKSLRQNSCAQVYTDGQGYSLLYPLKSKSLAWMTIKSLISDMNAIPDAIITDGAMEETGGHWKKETQHFRISQRFSEPYSQWQNRAEGDIRELKRVIRRTIQKARAPRRLWDFCGEWASAIRRKTALDLPSLNGMTPEETVHARSVDISAYAQIDWYSLVWYIDSAEDAATSRRKIGRWIGVAEKYGSGLTYYVLPKSCRPIVCSSVMPVSKDELQTPEVKALIEEYDNRVQSKIGDDRPDDDVIQEFPDMPPIPLDVFIDDDEDVDPVMETVLKLTIGHRRLLISS
jgi:hypothetical protein